MATRRRILVVEDDDALANQYRHALCGAGYDVAVAGDGLAALDDIDQQHPDLVVLELQMPSVGGETILSEAAATPDTCHIPFIVLAGAEAPATLRASAVLKKPCAPRDLVALVTQHLN